MEPENEDLAAEMRQWFKDHPADRPQGDLFAGLDALHSKLPDTMHVLYELMQITTRRGDTESLNSLALAALVVWDEMFLLARQGGENGRRN